MIVSTIFLRSYYDGL